jgi:hypothetical protein
MNKILSLLLLSFLSITSAFSQGSNVIYTSDIDNFWTAYDSIKSTDVEAEKLAFIKNLYINKATKGLKAFMKARQYTDTLWVELIKEFYTIEYFSGKRENRRNSKCD